MSHLCLFWMYSPFVLHSYYRYVNPTQPNKEAVKEVETNDVHGVKPRVWEEALRRVTERDAAEAKARKKLRRRRPRGMELSPLNEEFALAIMFCRLRNFHP